MPEHIAEEFFMKKLYGFVLVAAMLFTPAACVTTGGGDLPSLNEAIEQSAADIADKLPEGTRVAVAAFASPHENLSGYIMDELAGALTDGSLEVADRNNLEYVYKELKFQMSGEVDDESARSIGKFLGARYVITGQLVNTGGGYRYRLNGINVETAVHESSTRLDVRDDRAFKRLLAAVQTEAPVTRTAGYGTAPRTAGTFLDRGITFAGRGEYDLAIADFTEAVNLNPDLVAAWMLRGRALYASVSDVTYVGENFSGVVTVSTVGAVVSEEKKAVYDRAIADFTQAIRLDPDNAIAYEERGNAYASKGDYDRAIADFNQAIRINPDYVAAYNNRGNVYNDKGEYDRAIADYTQAIRINPNDAFAYNGRGSAYDDKGDHDRAIADYTRAVRINPDYSGAYYNRGNAYSDKREYDRAIADYTQAIRINPNYVAAYNNRGNAYKDKREYDRAIADYNQAIQINPNYASAYNNRGLSYVMKDDYARARADFEKALQLDPNQAHARQNLEVLRNAGL
jgi:tetratricopeptide (TPR) repeat protein